MAIAFILLLPATPLNTLPLCRIKSLDMFSDRERSIMNKRVILDDPNKGALFSKMSIKDILKTLVDYRLWIHCIINLLGLVPKGGLGLYSPSIIKALGFDTTKANALASVSNFGVCFLSFLISWFSDLTKLRGPWCIVACGFPLIFSGVLYGLPTGANQWARYAIWTILNSGNGIVQTLNDTWLSSNAPTHRHRSIGLALAVIGSNLGGLAGQQLFQDSDAPRYKNAFITILCLYAAAIVFILLQMALYMWENVRLRRQEQCQAMVEGQSSLPRENEL